MKKDLTGRKFGMLTAIRVVGRNKHNILIWECKCDCGNYKLSHIQFITFR